MRSLRVLSHLLAYPQADLLDNMAALKSVIAEEGLLKKKTARKLSDFMDELAKTDLMQAQENYVDLFDRGRAHCLHLFEHVHGESRLRGQAMLDLSERYAAKGLQLGVSELPDYLPVFLEFISISETEEGQELLTQAAPVIATIGEKLKRKKSGYASVFAAIIDISGARLNKGAIQKAASADLPEIKTLDELDKQWQEPEAFGAECLSCDPAPLQHAQRDQSEGVPS